MPHLRILVAPNAFKGSLDADAVAQAIARGLDASPLGCETILHPVGDGGDGTGALLMTQLGAQRIAARAHDARGRPIETFFGFVERDKLAIIEMADSAGLRLLGHHELDPLTATSFGTGEVIRAALDAGARQILLGLGGSATVDGGVGILRALGVRFLDGAGGALPDLPDALDNLSAIDRNGLDSRLANTRITLLCDVDNPLLGDNGAAAIFGPQKGADAASVELLEQRLGRLAAALREANGRDVSTRARGGAAGGTAASLHALLGAEPVSGIEQFLDSTGFDAALRRCRLVITGEGSIDLQTLQGKAPFGVSQRAKALGLPVIALAGRVPRAPPPGLQRAFDVLLAIGEGPATLAEAQAATAENLARVAGELGALLAMKVNDRFSQARSSN